MLSKPPLVEFGRKRMNAVQLASVHSSSTVPDPFLDSIIPVKRRLSISC